MAGERLLGAGTVIPRRYHLAIVTGLLVLAATLTTIFFDPTGSVPISTIVFGSLFGQTILSAAWLTLGPGVYWQRALLSVSWMILAGGSISANFFAYGPGFYDLGPFFVFNFCLMGQWFFVQGILWCLSLATGLKMQTDQETSLASDAGHRQFGIKQLMQFTVIVSVILAIGRAVVTLIPFRASLQEFLVIAFVFLAAVVPLLPLMLAPLLPRWWILAIFAGVVLFGFGTAIELPLIMLMDEDNDKNSLYMFALVNCGAATWVLVVTLSARWSGYRLARVTGPGK